MLNKIEGTSGVLAVEIAKKIAFEAGSLLVDRFNEIKEISVKGRGIYFNKPQRRISLDGVYGRKIKHK